MIVTTEKKNSYYINGGNPHVLFLHPILEHLIKLKQDGNDVKQWVENFEQDEIPAKGQTIRTCKQEVSYYYQYFQLLMKNNYFDTPKKVKLDEIMQYKPEHIELTIADTEQIVFEVTDGCNLDCRYCGYGEFYSGFDARRGRKMDFETTKQVLDYILSLKKKHLNQIKTHKKFAVSFYGGEPLTNFPLIKKVVEYVKSIDFPNTEFMFSMTTNGVLLYKYMDYLIENRFFILISLDGNKQHNQHRVFPDKTESFDIVFENARELKRKAPEYFKEFVNFICVQHNKNSALAQLKDFFKNEFDKKPLYLGLNKSGIPKEKKEEFDNLFAINKTTAELQERESFLKSLPISEFPQIPVLDEFSQHYSGCFFQKITSLLENKKENIEYVTTGTCQPFSKKIFITVNGKILPCERISQKFTMGTLEGGEIKLDYRAIADKYNDYYKKLSKLCNNCRNSKACKQCIFYLNIDEETVKCDRFLSTKEYSGKLSETLTMFEEKPLYYVKSLENLEKEGGI